MKNSNPILETNRLIIKQGAFDDYKIVYEYDYTKLRNINNEFEFVKLDLEKVKEYYNYHNEEPNNVFDFIIYIRDGMIPIGNVIGDIVNDFDDSLEIAFNMHPNFWRKGYMYEAIVEIIKYVFNNTNYDTIIYGYAKDNFKSKELCKKLGFKNYYDYDEYYPRFNKNVKMIKAIMTKKKVNKMCFKDDINELESLKFESDYIIKKGNLPILFTAPHTMKQIKEDGSEKLSEPYTKAIALYLNKHFNVNCMIKLKDTGLDANRDNKDDFKTELLRFIRDNNIKLVIDLHGSNESRKFDIEFGTLNNLSADFSTIKELEEAFTENGIYNIMHNDPFKGGAITEYVYGLKDVDVIQIEINGKYRDYNNLDKLEKLIKSFVSFVEQYKKYINK